MSTASISGVTKAPLFDALQISRLSPGLYWVSQFSSTKGVDHHAILDVGNRMRHPEVAPSCREMIIHQTPPSIRREPISNTGSWTILSKIVDEQSAAFRLREVCASPDYNVIGNNCEHFARYIATGVRESRQVQFVGLIGMAIGLTLAASR